MQKNNKLIAISVTTLLVLSMFAFALPANAVITLAGGAVPATGEVGSETLLAVTGASPGAQIQTYWENLAGMVLGNATTYADATGAVNIVVEIPDAVAGVHSIIVRDIATGATAGATFTVTPAITLTPSRGIPGDSIQVTGTGFPASKNITILFDGVDRTTAITTSSVTGNFTGAFVVPNLAYGDYPVTAQDNSTVPVVSPVATFTIGASVTISPTSGPSGTLVTATGRGFTNTAGLEIMLTIGGFPVINTTTIRTNADGTFTGQFLVPSNSTGFAVSTTRKQVEATDAAITGATSGTGGFRLTAGTVITVSPTSAPPGSPVTITGTGFAQISGTIVNVLFGATPAGTFNVATVNLADTSGNFTTTVNVPSLPTTLYNFNCTDTYGLNDTAAFQIAITALFATPTTGPSGTLVTLTGFGFEGATANVTLGSFRMLTNAAVSSLTAGTLQFAVPTMPAGTYTLTVSDDNLFTASTTFIVSATSMLTVNPTQAPVGLTGLTLLLTNFAQGETPQFFISNSTTSQVLSVTPVSGATVNGSLIFHGTFTVPTLALGAYTITANTTDGLYNATAAFTIGAAIYTIAPTRTVYYPGETISFNVQSTFPYVFYMNIRDPDSYPAIAFNYLPGNWGNVSATGQTGATVALPYAMVSYTLPSDAKTGTWTWLAEIGTFGTSTKTGTFTVLPAVTNVNLNQTVADIADKINALNSSITGSIASVNNGVATINTNLGQVQASLSSLNGVVTQINSGMATIQTSIGTIQTSLSNIDPVIGLIAGDTTILKTSIGEVQTSLASINTRVTSLEGDIATIQTDLGTLSGTVTSINGNIATIQTNLGTMQIDISNIQEDINGIQSDITSTKGTTEGLSPLIIAAIVLALIAAIAAIASIVMMRRKIAS